MKKNHTIIVYDENYNVEKKEKVSKFGSRFFGDNRPEIFGCLVLLIMVMALGSDRNKILEKSNILHKNLTFVEHSYESLKSSYDSLLVKEETYQVHYMIGKYSVQENTAIIKDTLFSFLEECGIWYPDIVFAQIVQESSIGKAVPEGNSNNLIGMMFPTKRETTAYGKTADGFAKYKNWQLCILDKILWDYNVFGYIKPSREEYISRLSIYAEDPNYITKIENIAKNQYRKK